MIDIGHDLVQFCVSCVSGYHALPAGVGLLLGVGGAAAGVAGAPPPGSGGTGSRSNGRAGKSARSAHPAKPGRAARGATAPSTPKRQPDGVAGTSYPTSDDTVTRPWHGFDPGSGAEVSQDQHGWETLSYPDGTRVEHSDYGTSVRLPDHTEYGWDSSGKLVFEYHPGQGATSVDADGQMHHQFPDGTIEDPHPSQDVLDAFQHQNPVARAPQNPADSHPEPEHGVPEGPDPSPFPPTGHK